MEGRAAPVLFGATGVTRWAPSSEGVHGHFRAGPARAVRLPRAPFRACHGTEVGKASLLGRAGAPGSWGGRGREGEAAPAGREGEAARAGRVREGEAAPPGPAQGPPEAAAGPGAPPAGGRGERAGWGARSAPCPARPPPPALRAPQAAAARRRQRWPARLRPSIPARLSPRLPLPPGPAPARGPSATGAPPPPLAPFLLSTSYLAGESRRLAPPGSLGAPQPSLLLPMGIREFPNGSARGKAATLWVPRGRAGGPGGRGRPTPPHLTSPHPGRRRRPLPGVAPVQGGEESCGRRGLGPAPLPAGLPPPTSPRAGGGRRRWQRGPGLTPLSRPAAACGAPPMSAPGGCPTSARSCGSSSTWWWTRPLKRTWSGPAPWKTSPARPWGSPPSRSASSASPATTATSPGPPATNVSPRHGRRDGRARGGGVARTGASGRSPEPAEGFDEGSRGRSLYRWNKPRSVEGSAVCHSRRRILCLCCLSPLAVAGPRERDAKNDDS